jgi:hypothetical protein
MLTPRLAQPAGGTSTGADARGFGDRRHRFAAGPHPFGERELVGCQLSQPADVQPTNLARGLGRSLPFMQRLKLKLGEAGELSNGRVSSTV